MPRGNPSRKLAITVDPEVHENILAAATRDGVSVSAWMTVAAREALQRRAGLAAVAQWGNQPAIRKVAKTLRSGQWPATLVCVWRGGCFPDSPQVTE